EIQRSISRHSPLPTILQAVTDGASSVLGGCPVSLLLDNARDPEHPVHVGASIVEGPDAFSAPVHVEGVPAGFLRATTPDGAPIGDEHRALLSTFAEHASLALTDARTVEAMHEAFHDPLTGLPNRLLFLDTLTEELARTSDRSVAVLFVDLDRFKAVNDTLGHAAGDELLFDVANRLRVATPAESSAARFGGDEFALFVVDQGDGRAAVELADRVIAALAEPFIVRGKAVVVGATVGIAHSGDGRSAKDLLADADLAMYRGKAAGGGRSATFDPQMRRDLAARLDLEAELSGALARGELAVVFQPIVDLVAGVPVAMEALLRWNHPTRGPVPPLDVIPIAEANGLIVPIGRWVLERAVHWVALWRQSVPDLRVSVNVSVHQLREGGFAEEVARVLSLAGVPPEALIVEVTESALIADHDETIGALKGLAAAGIAIALDDFGTGYSSLSYLQLFPVHILKIDRSFVSGEVGAKSSRLVQTVVGLGRAYELEVVAEGIEDEVQLNALRAMGCVLGQGYHLGRPSDPEAILQVLDGVGRACGGRPQALPGSAHIGTAEPDVA
ncbi:MAG: EAL domain-containing protein, partial [Demequinaceae bacterium]|nr:EAL domain-containing protein [Demequinaceae bacterium]